MNISICDPQAHSLVVFKSRLNNYIVLRLERCTVREYLNDTFQRFLTDSSMIPWDLYEFTMFFV